MTQDIRHKRNNYFAEFDELGIYRTGYVDFLKTGFEPVVGQTDQTEFLENWLKEFSKINNLWMHNPKDMTKMSGLWRETDCAMNAYDHTGRHYLLSNTLTNNGGNLITALSLEAWEPEGNFRDVEGFAEFNDVEALKAVNDAIQATEDTLVLFDKDLNYVLANDRWLDVHYRDRVQPVPGEHFDDLFHLLVDNDYYVLPEGVTSIEFVVAIREAVLKFEKNVLFTMQDGRRYIGGSHKTAMGGYLVSSKDITEQLEAEEELERQREIAHQNEKLSALGELLAGVAHELNNPMSIITGYSQMLIGEFDDPVLEQKVQRINTAAERSSKIIKAFLAMARQKPAKIEPCEFSEVVEIALDVAGYGLRTSGAEIIFEQESNIPPVAVDVDQMVQVVSNLIVNAEQAMSGKGDAASLRIKSSFDQSTQEVIVNFTDNGDGMSEAVKARIFEPFFTTKGVGQGTGFGLAFSHRTVSNHQGSLSVKSELGVGTIFEIRLPRAKIDRSQIREEARVDLQGMGRKILVVDDEEYVADIIREILTKHGFEVTIFNDPTLAIGTLGSTQYDAILSDFKMPQMTGNVFMERILELSPRYKNKIGFVTGDNLSQAVDQFFASNDVKYIEKPIVVRELLGLASKLCENAEGVTK